MMIFNVLKNINENTNEKNVETKKKINWNLELDNILSDFFLKILNRCCKKLH